MAAGAERRGPTKAERLAAAREARRRREKLRTRAFMGVVAVAVAATAAYIVNSRVEERREEERLNAILTAGECTVDERTDRGNESNHIPNPTYEVNPPSGGPHTPQSASAGVFDVGEAPPDGPLVHALEHGYVILWYRPSISPAELDRLKDIAQDDRYSNATLLVPRESLPVPVAATAWHDRLLCQGVEERPLKEFIEAHRDQGPEKGFIT